MTLQITGKNLDVGVPLRRHISDRVHNTVEKYIGPLLSGHIRVEKERSHFVTDCSIQLSSGLELQSRGSANDAYASADLAVDRLEKRLRRYKRRLKNHHGNQPSDIHEIQEMMDYIVQAGEDESEIQDEHNPIIIAETRTPIKELSVREAVMQLDLSNKSFLIFMNAKGGQLNVVYQRGDGNIGWIDPGVQAS